MSDSPDNGHGDFPRPSSINDLRRADFSEVDFGHLVRLARLGALIGAVLALLAGLGWLIAFRVDWLWFAELQHQEVLLRIVGTEVALFLAGAVVFAVFGYANLVFGMRAAPPEEGRLRRARRGVYWLFGIAVALGAVTVGTVIAGRWDPVLRWLHAVPFDRQEPIFNLDLGFYVFTLPILQLLRGWLLGTLVLVALGTAALYFVLSSLGLARFAGARMRLHLAGLGAALFALLAFGHWLGRYTTLYSSTGAVYGVGYRELHAVIPAQTLMIVVSLACAALLLFGALRNRRRLMIAAPALWLAAEVIALAVYPAIVQRFEVEPSELARERPFLSNHIGLTREAYGLDRISARSHPARGQIDAATIADNPGTVQNVRLWDEGPLRQSYNQVQFFRLYYDFLRVFTDRYRIDGELRQVMLSTRELSPEKLPAEAQRWVNRHLQFTHGYGVTMSPVTAVAADGRPAFFLKDVPPTGEVELSQPEVYYGLKSLDYVVTNTRMEEFNYPTEDGPVYSHYDGDGGVPMGGALRRALYAWHFGDINLLISDEISSDSRIQYHRVIGERVARLAPFLRLEEHPYAVVAGGRLYWIQDAYTVTDHFPYSLPWRGDLNYIRNSVKVVVDARNGDVDLYVADPEDPLVRAYRSIFPELFHDLEEMPAELRAHVRYPRDIFTVQVQMLLQYHMQDPVVFYNKEDQWSLPRETSFQQSRVLEPYYIVARLPRSQNEEFLLIQPFTPANRHNLVAWVAARNDPPHYGELVLFDFPAGRHVDGPNQVEARIDNDPVISEQFTLWGQVGSEVSRGNLLVIPLGDSILYAEPIFLRPETLDFPELRRIILADARTVVMHPTLDRSVAALVGDLPAVAQPSETIAVAEGAAEGAREETALSADEVDELVDSLEQTIRQLESLLERLRR